MSVWNVSPKRSPSPRPQSGNSVGLQDQELEALLAGVSKKRKLESMELTEQDKQSILNELDRQKDRFMAKIAVLERAEQNTHVNPKEFARLKKENAKLRGALQKKQKQISNTETKLFKMHGMLKQHERELPAQKKELLQKKEQHQEAIRKLQEKIRKLDENVRKLNAANKQRELEKSMGQLMRLRANHKTEYNRTKQEYNKFKNTYHTKYPNLAKKNTGKNNNNNAGNA